MKIFPFKSVEEGAVVTSSIVWETKGARTLFGRRGVRGLANVDITSETAVRIAMAFGTALKEGATVCASRDSSRSARALKRALIAGLNLAGINVMDLELATVPLTRFQVHNSLSQGGVTVRLAAGDPDTVEIRFFDEDGRDIDPGVQRKIERLLYRESGLKGVSGLSADMRVLHAAAADGHAGAQRALALFARRLLREAGALTAVLGGIDLLGFTGGIGEHDAAVRAELVSGLGFLGLRLDAQANRAATGDALCRIDATGSSEIGRAHG